MKGDFVNLGKQPIWGETQHMRGASIYISFNTALKQAGFGILIFMGEGTKIPFK